MKKQLFLLVLGLAGARIKVAAQTGDRVYTADQTSNTVSVIDPAIYRMGSGDRATATEFMSGWKMATPCRRSTP